MSIDLPKATELVPAGPGSMEVYSRACQEEPKELPKPGVGSL